MRYRYELSGVSIESDLPLTSLSVHPVAAREGAPQLTIRAALGPLPEPALAPLLTRSNDAGPWLSVFRLGDGYLFEVHDIVDFTLDPRRGEITCASHPDGESSVVEQLFIDQIFPLILHVSGRFSFHASSVALPGGDVIAFLGVAGRGKSTLASSLARRRAFSLFSDDCLALAPTAEGVMVYPSYPSSRLWQPSADALFRDRGELPFTSSRTEKRRVALPSSLSARQLLRVYLLEEGGAAPVIEPIRRRDALAALAAHLYRLDFQDRDRLTEEIAILERVVTSAEVKRLSYERSYAMLPAVHAAIRADTEGGSSGASCLSRDKPA